MSSAARNSAEREEVAFFGALAASATHELNNVLSVVDQVGGLLGDLAAKAAIGDGIAPQRLETLRDRIDRQVRKGVEIVQHLNSFAHSLDDAHEPFDAFEVLENLLGLSGRFAELARVRLERASWVEWRGTGDAFLFQRAVFEALQWVLAASTEGDRIEVGLQRDGQTGFVSISGSARCRVPDAEQSLARLARVLRENGGEYRLATADGGEVRLELRFPASSEGAASRDGT